MSPALAIAEPEPESRVLLEEQLSGAGFAVVAGEDPYGLVENERPDLLLLGDADALARWRPAVPVIVLGGPGAETDDRVRAFRRGCDDWVDRPFEPQELVERIRAVLRRRVAEEPPKPELIEAGPIRIDVTSRCATAEGRRLVLSHKEFELLCALAREPQRVFAKDELLRSVWRYPPDVRSRTLDSHASRLRLKLREAAPDHELVVNAWGIGYSLVGG